MTLPGPRAFPSIWSLVLLWVTAVAAELPPELDPAQFRADYRQLTAGPHRLSGTPEGRRAGDYIERELQRLPGQCFVQRFSVPQQIVSVCELRTSSGVLPLLPLYANGMQPSNTPRKGIDGRIVRVGKGEYADLDGKDLSGALVVMDFDANARGGVGMVALFRLGARAVIFVGEEDDQRDEVQPTRTPVSIDLPRFYVTREAARRFGLFRANRGTLVSQVRWERRLARNFFLWIRGTRPVFESKGKHEFLILSAHYDTRGIVPHRCKGQEGAANCAALLGTARRLAQEPPRRSVLIAFFDCHAYFCHGGREFYKAFRRSLRKNLDDPLDRRKEYVKAERVFLKDMIAFLTTGGVLQRSDHRRYDRAMQLLGEESRYRYDDFQERLSDARILTKALGREKVRIQELTPKLSEYMQLVDAEISQFDGVRRPDGLSAVEQARADRKATRLMGQMLEDAGAAVTAARNIAEDERGSVLSLLREKLVAHRRELSERVLYIDKNVPRLEGEVDRMAGQQKLWQRVRESIRDERPPDEKARGYLQQTVQAIVNRMENRLAELAEVSDLLDDSIRLTAPIKDGTPTFHVAYRFTALSDRWLFIPHGVKHKKIYSDLAERPLHNLAETERASLQYVAESKSAWESDVATEGSYNLWVTVEESLFGSVFFMPACDLITEQDKAPYVEMPNAPLAEQDLDRIRRHASHFLHFLSDLGKAEWARATDSVLQQRDFFMDDYVWEEDKAVGHQVRSFAYGQTAADRIEPNVLVHLQDHAGKSPDRYVFSDGNGCFPIDPILTNQDGSNHRKNRIEAGRFDDDGRLKAITTQLPTGPQGSVQNGWAKAGWYSPYIRTKFYAILNMFAGGHGMLLGRTFPFGDAFRDGSFRLLNGLSNSDYPRVHFRFDHVVGVGIYYVERPLGIKLVYLDPKNQDNVALYVNPTRDRPTGIGYGPGSGAEGSERIDLRTMLAPDLFRLNEHRLNGLRSKNIVLNFYEELHDRAKGRLERFYDAREVNRHGTADTEAAAVAALERRIYSPVIATTKDMVTAVTILLLLTIPFAFSMQSLVLSTYSIYRKLAGFMFIFVASFIVLYLTHPAFSFAPTPLIIFEAFFIIVMSAAVIWIIADKFTYEVKKLQGLATAAHTFEQSFFGNMGAAISLAISTMRRRPVRTALTVVTALLLTFTILSFVAFQAEKGINKFQIGSREDDPVSRLLVRRKVWKTFDRTVLEELHSHLGEGFQLHGRFWKVRELKPDMLEEDLHIPVRREAGGFSVAGALMSLDGLEVENVPGIRDVLPGRVDEFLAGEGVYLSQAIAEELKASPGDLLRLGGVQVKFLGVFDSRKLLEIRQIDGSPILPVNFSLTRMAIGKFESKGSAGSGDAQADLEAELAQLEAEALEPVSPDAVVLTPSKIAHQLGMVLKAVVIYPGPDKDVDKIGEDIAILFEDGVRVNKGGEASLYHYGDRFGVAGATDVIIPLILGGLIVFSTMLGSVIDREKEIYTFSALGLAPRNIAMLFFVEAGIYAVIGGFGGYLLSQATTRVLEVLASYGIFKAPEMNYSSSTAIYTILIVMATVIISTLYPAVQAARKATAETSKRWRIPAPQGDVLTFDFPFTISRFDITGILCFIREHFANHADRTVGRFASDESRLYREPEHGMAALSARLWLQPFDQGISQEFKISAHPSNIEEVCEIHIEIRRLSGPPVSWERSNRVFLEDLRSQFLLWRTLEDETREHYLTVADEVEAALVEAV